MHVAELTIARAARTETTQAAGGGPSRRPKRYNVVDFSRDHKEPRMSQVEWYYARDNRQMGPVSSAELKRLASADLSGRTTSSRAKA